MTNPPPMSQEMVPDGLAGIHNALKLSTADPLPEFPFMAIYSFERPRQNMDQRGPKKYINKSKFPIHSLARFLAINWIGVIIREQIFVPIIVIFKVIFLQIFH